MHPLHPLGIPGHSSASALLLICCCVGSFPAYLTRVPLILPNAISKCYPNAIQMLSECPLPLIPPPPVTVSS